MGIFRKEKPSQDPMDHEAKIMLSEFLRNYKAEKEQIDLFLKIMLKEYHSSYFLLMTLEDFQEDLNEKKEELNEKLKELENEKEINKINSILKEIMIIQHMINYYSNKLDLETISKIDQQKTKLRDFIIMLKNRKEYLEEVLNLNSK